MRGPACVLLQLGVGWSGEGMTKNTLTSRNLEKDLKTCYKMGGGEVCQLDLRGKIWGL